MKLRIGKLCLGALTVALLAGLALIYGRTDSHQKSVDVDGVNREYLFYAPKDCDAELPLLLVYHGFSGNADRVRKSSKLHELVDEHKFYLAYLDGDPTWRRPKPGSNCPDVDFFDKLVAELETQHSIDQSRIYIAGMSMGGDFVIRLGGLRSEKIAAVVSQGMITDEAVEAKRAFPLRVIVGTKDDRVSPELIPAVPNAFRDRGHIVKVVRPDGVGHWWHAPLNQELWSFLSNQSLEGTADKQ